MPYASVIAIVILGALVLYALTGGADYGGGMWDLLAFGKRRRQQRELIEEALAPIWEANHVWLILVVTVIFAAFPPAFAAIMTALHVPLTIVLVGIVLRGSAFIFRKYDARHDRTHERWSRVFGVASFLTPFFLGLCLGALASGEIRLVEGQITTGFWAGWTSAFAVGCGLFAQGLFALLAATYLTVDAEESPALQEDFRRRALFAELSLGPAAALVLFLARGGAPLLFEGLTSRWAPWVLFLTSVCAVAVLWGLWQKRYRVARLAAAGQVALILLGWGLAQWPYLIVPDLTFQAAATSTGTLRMLAWALGAGALLLFPSFAYLFYVFRGGPPTDALKSGAAATRRTTSP